MRATHQQKMVTKPIRILHNVIVLVDGTCFNISAGSVNVELRMGPCPKYGENDGSVGWGNNRQLLIMEIIPRTATAGIIFHILV